MMTKNNWRQDDGVDDSKDIDDDNDDNDDNDDDDVDDGDDDDNAMNWNMVSLSGNKTLAESDLYISTPYKTRILFFSL